MMRQAALGVGVPGMEGSAVAGLNDQWFAKFIAPWQTMTPILSMEVMGFDGGQPALPALGMRVPGAR